jgi:predicted secreted protein
MGLPLMLALMALLSAALLASCGGSSAAPKTIELTPVVLTGSTIDAAVGDTIIVNLKANATTGFAWTFTAGDTFEIVSSNYAADPNPPGTTGAGGKQIVTLKVTKIGASDLRGTYRQPWNPVPPGASPDFIMTVLAK